MEQYNKNYEEIGITILNSKPDFDRLEAGFHFRLNNCTVPALKKLGLALNDLFMYLHLVTKVNGYEDGTCYMSTEALMRELDMPKTTVHRSKKKLTELGLITLVKEGGNSTGRNLGNVYRVNYPVLTEALEIAEEEYRGQIKGNNFSRTNRNTKIKESVREPVAPAEEQIGEPAELDLLDLFTSKKTKVDRGAVLPEYDYDRLCGD